MLFSRRVEFFYQIQSSFSSSIFLRKMGIKFNLILAKSENNGIGYKGGLPWKLGKEMNYFSRMTKHVEDPKKRNAVIMGRLTWESMNGKSLPGRFNIVLSSKPLENLKNAVHCRDFEEVVKLLESPEYNQNVETAWVIGGSKVYETAVKDNLCHRIYLTKILKEFPCDVFVNLDLNEFKEVEDSRVPKEIQEEDGIQYSYHVYEKVSGFGEGEL